MTDLGDRLGLPTNLPTGPINIWQTWFRHRQLMNTVTRLPAECLLRIFDLLEHHKATLVAAAAVCRAWTAPAQSALFRRVDLHSTRQVEAYLAIKQLITEKRLVTRELELDLDRDGVRREAVAELLAGQDRLVRLLIQTGLQSIPSSVLRSPELAGENMQS